MSVEWAPPIGAARIVLDPTTALTALLATPSHALCPDAPAVGNWPNGDEADGPIDIAPYGPNVYGQASDDL